MLISFKYIGEEREKYLKTENITLMAGSETKNWLKFFITQFLQTIKKI